MITTGYEVFQGPSSDYPAPGANQKVHWFYRSKHGDAKKRKKKILDDVKAAGKDPCVDAIYLAGHTPNNDKGTYLLFNKVVITPQEVFEALGRKAKIMVCAFCYSALEDWGLMTSDPKNLVTVDRFIYTTDYLLRVQGDKKRGDTSMPRVNLIGWVLARK